MMVVKVIVEGGHHGIPLCDARKSTPNEFCSELDIFSANLAKTGVLETVFMTSAALISVVKAIFAQSTKEKWCFEQKWLEVLLKMIMKQQIFSKTDLKE